MSRGAPNGNVTPLPPPSLLYCSRSGGLVLLDGLVLGALSTLELNSLMLITGSGVLITGSLGTFRLGLWSGTIFTFGLVPCSNSVRDFSAIISDFSKSTGSALPPAGGGGGTPCRLVLSFTI